MGSRLDVIRRMARSMAVSDGLEYVTRMPERRRVKNPHFKTHVDNRMQEAARLYAAIQAMKTAR